MSKFVAASLLVGGAVASLESEFAQFVQTYNKHYESAQEMQERFEIFKHNRLYQETENAKQSTYTLGVNEFSDLPSSEFSATHFGYTAPQDKWGGLLKLGEYDAQEGELGYGGRDDDLDWSVPWMFLHGEVSGVAVTPVKNQGKCGSCWAFSTTGALEGAWFLATKKLVSISEQQFLDCSKQNDGCAGGLMNSAFEFAEGQALCTEQSYPYKMQQNTCSPGGCDVAIPKGGVIGYFDVKPTESAMLSALNKQPLSVGIEADKSAFQSYTSGVLGVRTRTGPSSFDCGTQLNHGLLLVGYGFGMTRDIDRVSFWKVKNSWGASWGEGGYMRLVRETFDKTGTWGPKNECGILSAASFPQVDGGVSGARPTPSPSPQPPAHHSSVVV